MSDLELVEWIARVTAWGFLLKFAVRFGHLRRYPWLFACVFTDIFLSAAMGVLAFLLGLHSLVYYYIFVAASLVSISLGVAALLSIYRVFGSFRISRDWHFCFAAFIAALFILIASPKGMLMGIRALNWGFGVLTYTALAVTMRMVWRRDVDLGWNLKMALFALSVPPALQSLVFVGYSIALFAPYERASFWASALAISSWIILAVGMSESSPPTGRGLSPSLRENQPQGAAGIHPAAGARRPFDLSRFD